LGGKRTQRSRGEKKIGIASGKWQDRREEKDRNSKWQIANQKRRGRLFDKVKLFWQVMVFLLLIVW